ncbi:MAG: PepSY-associated TM helix domain-containing protein [Planctomycetota bacterium]
MEDRDLATSRRWVPQFIRSLHIWLSMIAFAVTLLFSVTGFTLNHTSWFESAEPTVTRFEGTVDAELATNDLLELAETLRAAHRLRGRVVATVGNGQTITMTWQTAGYTAKAFVEIADGSYSGSVSRRGFWAILDDLHRGQDCGPVWSVIVDVAAVLLALLSITGLWLMLYLKKRLRTGMVLGFLGGAAVAVSYVFTVR